MASPALVTTRLRIRQTRCARPRLSLVQKARTKTLTLIPPGTFLFRRLRSSQNMSALSTMIRHFEEMCFAQLPSQSNQSTSAHFPFRPSVVNVHVLACAPLSFPFSERAHPHATRRCLRDAGRRVTS